MKENEIGDIIIDSALTIHRELGPGLMELVYEVVLAHEIEQRGLKVKKQVQTYLKLTGHKLGYLLNFNEELIKQGITRCVNQLEE